MPPTAQYELLPRSSLDDNASTEEFKDKPLPRRQNVFFRIARKTRRICRVCRPIYVLIGFIIFCLWQILFNGSYVDPLPFMIPQEETVFIAANIIDGDLIGGAWGRALLELVELIGKEKVYVSIYGGPKDRLELLGGMLECEHSFVSEEQTPLDMSAIPRTTLPTGEKRIKRIAYLAEVRNKALEPLDRLKKRFDKVLFINDVHFEAEGAARLLWGTNVDEEGKARYKAACGTDFVAWWKFYDTFATRDTEGYSIGVPIFPWFSTEGEAITRKDILAGKDAVRVKSCWGGMTAFDARYFQVDVKGASKATREPPTLPLRFRSEPEPFWDSSECCLIHADIMALPPFPMSPVTEDKWDQGIYMNPNVRVSYDARTQARLGFARRVERLFALPQAIINHFAHMPRFNARRTEIEGEVVKDRGWKSNPESVVSARATIGEGMDLGVDYWAKKGHYVDEDRTANRGGYCGVRQLLVIKEGNLEPGEGNWDNLLNEVPPLGL
ncbi:hypothetical protein HYALB_00010675 [Hymenoscyphus albidus]|uniref:Glycosyltransferase family 69 protein n=1 Tax=Hymenoscyphus albidus TaxID=595503 RepID=A0A9N9PQ99_9HELO|nr:hypothetical protein HYALB_00010675 [Hymenoscyphus albidus]